MFRHIKFRLPFWSPLLPLAAMLGYAAMVPGCANTTTPPSGGPKDTIPPVLRKVEPLPGTVGVSSRKPRLEFTFDEYVKIKNMQNILLSPPLRRPLKAKTRGKSVVVEADPPLEIQFDGETPPITTPLRARILNRACRFIVSEEGYSQFSGTR